MNALIKPRLKNVRLLRGHTYLEMSSMHSGLVIDAGSHKCEFSNKIANMYRARVIALEPNSHLINEENNKLVSRIDAALGGADQAIKLKIFSNPESSTIVSESRSKGKVTSYLDTSIISLESLFCKCGLSSVQLLKMDIESSEYDVIHSMTLELAEKIKSISIEFHPSETNTPSDRIVNAIDRLEKLGFYTCKASYKGFGDVLFLNQNIFEKPTYAFKFWLPRLRKLKDIRNR